MKKYFIYRVVLCAILSIARVGFAQIEATTSQTYHSPNTKTDAHIGVNDMLHLDYRSLFNFNILSGGIIGDIHSGGKIMLKVYAYDDDASNGKGKMVYGIELNHSATHFSGSYWDVQGPHWWSSNIKSTDIRALSQQVKVYVNPYYLSPGCNQSTVRRVVGGIFSLGLTEASIWAQGGCPSLPPVQPVIVEATVQNAVFKKLLVPGMGEFDATEIFHTSRPIAAVNGKVTLGSHRGNWQDVLAPENTKNAVKDMFNQHYDMIELDLWSTLDSQIIVFHDMGLSKRTTQTGGVRSKNWNEINNLYIKNRFDELIVSSNTKIELLGDMLDFIRQQDPEGLVFLNLDRSANDMNMFKRVYQVVNSKGMLDRAIFKGRFNPEQDANGEIAPTVATLRQAFKEMFPSLTPAMRDNKLKMIRYTPILFDNPKRGATTNDDAFAARVKQYIDDMLNAGFADGFELNFKSYPVGSPAFANQNNDFVFLLQKWPALGNKNFVEYVHSKGLPVGIFASVPEVCAIPDFNADGTRNANSLVSGFIKEDYQNNFNPEVRDQGTYDFRGDWDFYIPAGVDFVITDRPDALREYLKAIGRF